MIDLSNILNDKIEAVEVSIKRAAFERDNSATPMESQHDQTRQVANQLYNCLVDEKRSLQLLTRRLCDYHSIYHLKNLEKGVQFRFFIVPDGLGGKTVEGVTLISDKTPLSQIIIDKKEGYQYELNGQNFRIEKIEENK